MTLKNRLRLTILLPLMAVAVGYSLLSLLTVANVLFREASERASLLASQAQTLLVQRVTENAQQNPPPTNAFERKQHWANVLIEDRELSKLLLLTMASTRIALAIDVRGADGMVLSSSDPLRINKPSRPAMRITEFDNMSRARQIWHVLTREENYESLIALGEDGKTELEVSVIISSTLLRNTLVPEVTNLAVALGFSLLVALALAVLASNLAFLPLRRLSEAVDKISRGEALGEAPQREAQEVQAVEFKLSLLGEKVRGAREDLEQMRSNIDQLLERMEDAVLLFDENENLVNAGKTAEKFLGRGRWELAGAHINEVFPSTMGGSDIVHSAVSLKRNISNVEVFLNHNGGPPRRVLLDLEMLADYGPLASRGFILRLRDAEAKISLSKQLDVSRRLSALNRLTGGVAHEIKNPLNSIGLHLALLESRIPEDDTTAREELKILRDETRRLDRVVKTFLDFTRPVELRLARVNLFELTSGLLQFLMPEAQSRQIDLSLECEDHQATIRGDEDLLKQAFLNLYRNALDAMPKGGPIVARILKEHEGYRLEIEDRGVGISPENREKIFQLYFTTKAQGSGIGLAVTYRVVQLHNASIDFESKAGEGTKFVLRFPAWSEE